MRTSAGSGRRAGKHLSFRPASYFWPLGLEQHLLATVKGAARKKLLQSLIDQGRVDEIPEFIAQSDLPDEERTLLGRVHPLLMGGEYLPSLGKAEVEIARISIQSTTGDVTSVYAQRGKGRTIHYRIVDEYGGETLVGRTKRWSRRPLSLGELVDWFLSAWSLVDCCEANHEDDLEGALRFFEGQSAFYDLFDEELRERVIAAFDAKHAASAEETGETEEKA